MLKNKKKGFFYPKSLLNNILFILLITIISSLSISYFANKNNQTQFLKKYDMILNDLHTTFNNKLKNFPNTIGALFVTPSHYQDLCTLLKTENPDELPSLLKKNVVDIFSDLCNYDNSSVGILLHSSVTNQLYQYIPSDGTITPIKLDVPFPDIKPFEFQILSDSTISNLSSEYKKTVPHVFALTGTVFENQVNGMDVLGTILVLYSTNELSTLVSHASLSEDVIYSITDNSQNILFNSSNNYLESDLPVFDTSSLSSSDIVSSPISTHFMGGEKYFHSSIYNGRYEFSVNYQVKAQPFAISYIVYFILLLGVILCIFFIILHVATFNSTYQKVNLIKEGMHSIGTYNLGYRIKPIYSNDEFDEIIEGFNHMCNELETNVEKRYSSELLQKKAELYALQTSIDPHFLYNTLEIIRVQSLQGKSNEVSEMILLLSKIYRNIIKQEAFVSLHQELEHCENFMELYQYRYHNFEYDFLVDDKLLCYMLPRNILQPIFENYFVHGINLNTSDNYIELSGKCIDIDGLPYINLTFSNNGHALSPEKIQELNYKLNHTPLDQVEDHGFALINIQTRLRLAFDNYSSIIVESPKDSTGFIIHVIFPLTSYSKVE